MTTDLRICNPSNYPRAGFVTTAWAPILATVGIPPGELALSEAQGRPVTSQIDRVDPQNPARDVLVFYVSETMPCGPEDYSSPSCHVVMSPGRKAGGTPLDASLRIDLRDEGQRLELVNSQLVVSFGLRPPSAPKDVGKNWWYAGSATSVRLNGKEMLELWNHPGWWEGHDSEKRCMQIDRIFVGRQPWETSAPQEFPLFDRPYELISSSGGPVRASITVASEPFDYGYYDLSANCDRHLECRLFRVISLYANVDYILEELFVEGKPKDTRCGSETMNLDFSARYFACMDMGPRPHVYQFAHVPDWFAVGWPEGNEWMQHPGYGFACDVHVYLPLAHPHPHYHDGEKKHKTFSWQLHPCKKATCLHLLMHGKPGGFDSRIGHNWYELLYKPLKAIL